MATITTVVLSGGKVPAAQSQVASVAGKTGAVSLAKADVGLGSVDNTSDANKPVSTAQAAAISAAVNGLVNGAPGALDTLDELAAALGDNASFAATVTNSLAGKQATIPQQTGAPSSPTTGALWLDTTNSPHELKRYNGTIWVTVGAAGSVADGSVTKAKLATAVQTSVDKADTAVQPATTPTLAGVRVTGGAPASGKVLAATDNLGNSEWTTGANVELAYAEISTESPIANTVTDIPGLSITFATAERPAMIKAYMSGVQGTGDGTWQFQLVRVSDGAVLALGICNTTASPSVAYPPAPTLELRIPAGTASNTYKVQAYRVAGSATGGKINPANKKAFIQAVSV